jgi:hypothetical protein
MMVPNASPAPPAPPSGITINSTPITGGSSGNLLYDNAGTVGELTLGSGISIVGGALTFGITINTTAISGGTSPRVLYDNAGAVGEASAFSISSGQPNVAVGSAYLYNSLPALFEVPIGLNVDCWFVGNAGNQSVTGHSNMGMGELALAQVTSGGFNMAMGTQALYNMTTGASNVAIGQGALYSSTADSSNIGIGSNTGLLVNGGGYNTLIGYGTGGALVGGSSNIVLGAQSGMGITSGNYNTVIGASGAPTITTGYYNVSIGFNCDVPVAGGSGQVSIGNFLYGTNCTGTGATISSGWMGLGVKSAYGSEKLGVAGGICVAGDPGAGVASTNMISNGNSTTISTGVGSVRMSTANAATNTGWLKCYIGTQVAWIPCWTTNAP